MRKYLALSVIASTLLMAGGDVKPVEPVVEATPVQDMGTVSGQIRTFYVDRTYDQGATANRNALSLGGWIKYETPVFSGLSAGVALYGVNGFNIHDNDIDDEPNTNYDPSLNGFKGENYGFIGEAYLNYASGNTNVKVGRQKLNTPLAGADDARMLPNLFEAAVVSNTDIEDTTLIVAHVTRETTGTFSNIYDDNAALGFASGYGAGTTLAQSGDFKDMGVVALGAGTDTDGVTAGAVIYKGIDNLTLQAWDYYAHDILNAVYLQADAKWNCLISDDIKPFASFQYIYESEVGDALAGNVDSSYWGAKLGGTMGNLTVYGAYSKTGDSSDAYAGGIITPWGGMPAFTQGMVTRHQFLSGADTWKVAGTYKMNELVGANVKASAYYCSFDVGDTSPYAAGAKSTEAGFDIQYQATEALNLRFRGNFPRDFTGIDGTGWDEYRLIANYNF